MPAVAFCANMERERDAALRQLDELRKDKERIDWLEKAKCAEYREGACEWTINGWNGPFGDTLREAIDAAKEAQ